VTTVRVVAVPTPPASASHSSPRNRNQAAATSENQLLTMPSLISARPTPPRICDPEAAGIVRPWIDELAGIQITRRVDRHRASLMADNSGSYLVADARRRGSCR